MFIEDTKDYVLKQNGTVVETGDMYKVREKIEDLLADKIGMFVSLQENTDDDEYRFYLHTDNEEDLTEEQLEKLAEYGISVNDDENSELNIRNLLGITVLEA